MPHIQSNQFAHEGLYYLSWTSVRLFYAITVQSMTSSWLPETTLFLSSPCRLSGRSACSLFTLSNTKSITQLSYWSAIEKPIVFGMTITDMLNQSDSILILKATLLQGQNNFIPVSGKLRFDKVLVLFFYILIFALIRCSAK